MSLEEWADLHGEDYPKGKFFSALDYGRGDRTSMTIYCDYCEQSFEIKEDEFEDWIIVDPASGDKAVMCGECWSRRTQRAADATPAGFEDEEFDALLDSDIDGK